MLEDWNVTIKATGEILIYNYKGYKITYNLIQDKKDLDYNKYKVKCPKYAWETFKSHSLTNCLFYIESQESNSY